MDALEIHALRDEHYNAGVEYVRHVHDELMILRVRPDGERPHFVPGQYTTLGLGGIWWAMSVSNPLGALLTVAWFLGSDWKQTRLLDDIRLEAEISDAARMEENITT